MRFRILATTLIACLPLAAQKPVEPKPQEIRATAPDPSTMASELAPVFPKPAYFRHHLKPPQTRVELQAPVRLQDFVHDGKLEMSLRDFLELVLANNTDVAIQRLNLEIPRNNILRQYGIFDPAFVGTFNASRAKSPARDALAGANVVNSLSQRGNFSYNQTLQTGTQFNVGFVGTKTSDNNSFSTYNPALGANLSFGFTQPLIRNRGAYITRLPIMVARSTLRRSEYSFRDQLMRVLTTAENAYWDVIDARENLKVQEKFLELTNESLKRAQRELELGALSPLDIYRNQQSYANAEIQVSRLRFQLAQREDVLRRQFGVDLDPDVRKLPIILTETVMPPVEDKPADAEAAVEKAMRLRPDLKVAEQSLDIDELSIKSATNALRPDLSLTGGYSAAGRGGTLYERENVFGGGGGITRTIPGGFGDALSQLFGFNIPTYQFSLTLRLPIRDRRGSADLANALVQKRLDALNERNTRQTIRLDVLNAINALESAKAGVKLAEVAVNFADLQVKAEQKKYDLGTNIMYFVLQAQADLANAQSELVRQSIQYRRAQLNLLRFTGELLDERGVVIK